MEDLRVLFLFYMIEGALVGFIGMALIGFRMNLKQFVLVGVLQGIVVYLVRGIYTINDLRLGTHTAFNLIGLVLVLYLVTRKSLGSCLVSSLLGIIIVIFSEVLTLPMLYTFLNTTVEKVFADLWTHIVMGYVGDWLVIVTAVILVLTGKSLISVQETYKG